MNRLAARSFASFCAVLGGSFVVACSSAPDEKASQSSADLVVPHCPYGQHVDDCESDEGPRGPIISCTCAWNDNFFSITSLATTPSESTNPDGAWLDVSPDPTKYPYPPELSGAGCSKTAVYHRYGAAMGGASGPDPGARIWICATDQLYTPSVIAPTQSPKYEQVIVPGTHFDSPVLGSAKSGWTIVAEKLYTACDYPCVINHGCSGSCGAGPTP